MEAKPNTIQRRQLDRLRWLEAGAASEHHKMTEHQKATVLRLTEEGATLVEIAALDGMPSISTVFREAVADATFDAALRSARAANATSSLEEAQQLLREAAQGNDTDKMIIASAYHRGTEAYAAKIAPKEYGQLVKLAGADGGALTIQTISYAAMTGNEDENRDRLARDKAITLQASEVSATLESEV